jgi:hypothetical protein
LSVFGIWTFPKQLDNIAIFASIQQAKASYYIHVALVFTIVFTIWQLERSSLLVRAGAVLLYPVSLSIRNALLLLSPLGILAYLCEYLHFSLHLWPVHSLGVSLPFARHSSAIALAAYASFDIILQPLPLLMICLHGLTPGFCLHSLICIFSILLSFHVHL